MMDVYQWSEKVKEKVRSNKYLLFLPFICVGVLFFIGSAFTYHFKRVEYQKYTYFEVDSVEITKDLSAFLYDKNNEKLTIKNFTFYRSSGIKTGDIIIKNSYSDSIKAYRKDSIGNLKEVYKAKQPETIFDFLDNIFPLPEKGPDRADL